MSCEHEHQDHSHGHGHGDHNHDHSHDLEPALQSNLYKQIQFDQIRTYNEAEARSGAGIVQKTWTDRLADTPVLESDVDEQLLMHIPYVPILAVNLPVTSGRILTDFSSDPALPGHVNSTRS